MTVKLALQIIRTLRQEFSWRRVSRKTRLFLTESSLTLAFPSSVYSIATFPGAPGLARVCVNREGNKVSRQEITYAVVKLDLQHSP